MDKSGCGKLGEIASRIAEMEGLMGHKNAADLRVNAGRGRVL